MSYEILVVDDEDDIRNLITGILEDEGYVTRSAPSGLVALDMIKHRQPHLVLLDVWLGNGERDGIKILETIKRNHAFVPVIMISGHSTIETAVSAIKKGAYDFIEKPFQSDRLLLVIGRAIESANLQRENEELKLKARISAVNLLGNTQITNQLKLAVKSTADSLSKTMIMGPFGAGKEMIAREIHQQSDRSKGLFISINCGALHPHKFEEELFGTEIVGSDSNAPRKIGLLEKAHLGTLYFDEITQLPLPLQSKLVRILQDQAFCRIGSDRKVEFDVRIISGTSEDVKDQIAKGNFREDLYYRLSVNQIVVPSLRDRSTDVSIIAQKLMDDAAKASNAKSRFFSEEALVVLQSYNWPGDFVQLRNVIDWILIMSKNNSGDPILSSELPQELSSNYSFQSGWQAKNSDVIVLPLREAREAFERDYLMTQVSRFAGNISQTARFIGMERSALHRKLRSLKVYDFKGKEDDDFYEAEEA